VPKRSNIKIAGITRIADMPFNPVMAIKLSYYVDHLVLGFDSQGGYGRFNDTNYIDGATWLEIFKRVHPFPDTCTVDMFLTNTIAGYRRGHVKKKGVNYYFLQELLNRLDRVKPDIVLECEADAHYDYTNGFLDDLEDFINSDCDYWMMATDTETIDGREVPWCPKAPHCRAYKWYPGIEYSGALCRVVPENGEAPKIFRGKTNLKHYHLFTKKVEHERYRYYGEGQTYRFFRRADIDVPNDVKDLFK